MKLYEVPRNTWVTLLETLADTAPGSPPLLKGDKFKLHHVDGMYSFCTTEDRQAYHPAAWTEVEIVQEEQSGT